MSFCKVLVIGPSGVGKTSLITKIVYDAFSNIYRASIGCDYALKVLTVRGETVRVQIWDLAGQDRFQAISRFFCKEADGAIVVADVTNKDTIQQSLKWKEIVEENTACPNGSKIPMVLCFNKIDILKASSQEELDHYVRKEGFYAGFFTSAKDGTNAEAAIMKLAEVIKSRITYSEVYKNSTKLSGKINPKKKCC